MEVTMVMEDRSVRIKKLTEALSKVVTDSLSKIGYEEPVYQRENVISHEDVPFTYLRKFYDEYGTVRKVYTEGFDRRVHFIEVYSEDGKILLNLLTKVSMREPLLYAAVHSYSPVNRDHYLRVYSLSLKKDFSIVSVEDRTS